MDPAHELMAVVVDYLLPQSPPAAHIATPSRTERAVLIPELPAMDQNLGLRNRGQSAQPSTLAVGSDGSSSDSSPTLTPSSTAEREEVPGMSS